MIIKSAQYWIDNIGLIRHPEGGWFKEIYRSEEIASRNSLPKGFNGDRNFSTSIYFLLEKDEISILHRIKSDEIWHYYDGDSAVEIVCLEVGKLRKQILGCEIEKGEQFQIVAPKNTWFGARLINQESYALLGCTVSPGFYFDDLELADKRILEEYPELKNEIAFFINK